MVVYNWQQEDWPDFRYNLEKVEPQLFEYAQKAGQAQGISQALPPEIQIDQVLHVMVEEAIKTSEIEGVYLSRKDVISSIRKNLGLEAEGVQIRDVKARGIAEMLMDARKTFQEPLSHPKLFEWHSLLMAKATDIEIGKYRTHPEPMQVVSGAAGKDKVHFEAPPSEHVPGEMDKFIRWFNETAPDGSLVIHAGPIRSAIAHLYFETIHPFEDGNGRVGRAIAEKVLSQHLNYPVLFSLSGAIESKKNEYYNALEEAQRSNEITSWINYFVETILAAQASAAEQIEYTLRKSKFFDRYHEHLNDRQLKVILRMFEEGPGGFKGGMNATKYISIAKTSKATATRDLQELVSRGILIPSGAGGRSTSYELRLVPQETK